MLFIPRWRFAPHSHSSFSAMVRRSLSIFEWTFCFHIMIIFCCGCCCCSSSSSPIQFDCWVLCTAAKGFSYTRTYSHGHSNNKIRSVERKCIPRHCHSKHITRKYSPPLFVCLFVAHVMVCATLYIANWVRGQKRRLSGASSVHKSSDWKYHISYINNLVSNKYRFLLNINIVITIMFRCVCLCAILYPKPEMRVLCEHHERPNEKIQHGIVIGECMNDDGTSCGWGGETVDGFIFGFFFCSFALAHTHTLSPGNKRARERA